MSTVERQEEPELHQEDTGCGLCLCVTHYVNSLGEGYDGVCFSCQTHRYLSALLFTLAVCLTTHPMMLCW